YGGSISLHKSVARMAVTGHARRIALHEGRGETELGRVELDGGANVARRQARVVLIAFDGGDLPCWFGVFHRGSRSTLSPILKIAVLAPMPIASVSTATAIFSIGDSVLLE